MPAPRFRRLPIAATLMLAAMAVPAGAQNTEEGLLIVDRIAGLVQVQRSGQQYSLREGDALVAGDVLLTDGGGQATLTLARYGFVELGSNAQIAFEALPHSSYSRDLRTVFNLAKGYLRVVWKRPQSATAWPLQVTVGPARAVLGSGEYFFQQGTEPRLCAAAGVLAVQLQAVSEAVRPPACAAVQPDGSLVVTARDPSDWIKVRSGYSVRAGEPVIAEPRAAVAAAAPVRELPPPKPGMDYSLLEDAGAQPGIVTSAGADGRAPMAAPSEGASELAATEAAPERVPNRFEIAATPASFAAPQLPAAGTPPAGDTVAVAMAQPRGRAAVAVDRAAAPRGEDERDGDGAWRINIGSFFSTDDAEALRARAERAAVGDVRAVPAEVRGQTYIRVQVGSFPSAARARAAAARVRRALGLSDVWFARDDS